MVAEVSTSFNWTIENKDEFLKSLDRLSKATSDFRIPFRLIASDWYRSNRQLFSLKSQGLYQDLAPAAGQDGNPTTTSSYKDAKLRDLGFVYPILVGATKDLSTSLLSRTHKHSELFIGRQELFMGTSNPYAIYHQSDRPRSKIPQRKIVFIDGGPADKSSGSGINGRRERWINIVDDHLEQLLSGTVL